MTTMEPVMKNIILLIEDNNVAGTQYLETLEVAGYEVIWAKTANAASKNLRPGPIHAVIADLKLPDANGLDLIREIHQLHPALPILLVSAYIDNRAIIEAMSAGVYDYFEKPAPARMLLDALQKAIQTFPRQEPPALLVSTTDIRKGTIIGRSPAIQLVYKELGRIAPLPVTVLITGETGVGKDLIAQALHDNSPRVSGPYIPINMAAIPENLLESELFGHERGAFTGAHSTRKGRFEDADGGTIFLDEIGDMPLSLQAKILRVVENHRIQHLGGNRTRNLDVRIVAATHQDLDELIAQGKFRADLYHRLAVVNLHIPPLRDRPTDIPLLVDYFLRSSSREYGFQTPPMSESVIRYLTQQSWPGNIRELENVIRKALIRSRGLGITLPALRDAIGTAGTKPPNSIPPQQQSERPIPAATRDQSPELALKSWISQAMAPLLGTTPPTDLRNELIRQLDVMLISEALERTDGNRTRAAELIGINRIHDAPKNEGQQPGL